MNTTFCEDEYSIIFEFKNINYIFLKQSKHTHAMSENDSFNFCLEKLEEIIPNDIMEKAAEDGKSGDSQIIMAAAIYIQNLEDQVNYPA